MTPADKELLRRLGVALDKLPRAAAHRALFHFVKFVETAVRWHQEDTRKAVRRG